MINDLAAHLARNVHIRTDTRQGTQAGLFFDAQRRRAITRLHGGAVMSSLTLDVSQWAEQQFGTCDLGDKRRTNRLVKLATQVATKPDAATPEQTENWADCKAAYRLVDQEEVTFDAVIAPHCLQTRAVEAGIWLVIDDTTEINFGSDRALSGVGRVGSPWVGGAIWWMPPPI